MLATHLSRYSLLLLNSSIYPVLRCRGQFFEFSRLLTIFRLAYFGMIVLVTLFWLLLRPLPSSAGPISRLNIRLSPKRFTFWLSSGTFWWILVSRRKPVCPYGNVVGYLNNFFWKSRRTPKTPKLTWSHTGWSPRHTPAVFPTSSGPWQSSFSLRILVSKLFFLLILNFSTVITFPHISVCPFRIFTGLRWSSYH